MNSGCPEHDEFEGRRRPVYVNGLDLRRPRVDLDDDVTWRDAPSVRLMTNDNDMLPPSGRRPHFAKVPPSHLTVNEGDPLTLRCVVEGDPRPVGKLGLWHYWLA
jgi:hypothetical protein